MAKAKKSSAKKAAPKKAGAAKAKSAIKALAKKAVGTIKGAAKSAKKAAAKPAKKAAGKSVAKAPAKKAASKSSSSAPQKTASTSAASSKSKSINWENFLTPLDDRLIVEVSTGEKMTPGGLYIPDTVSDASGNFKGKVLVAGRGHRDAKGKIHPMEVKAGNVILFSEYSGAKMNLLDQEVRILRESEVLGIVEKN